MDFGILKTAQQRNNKHSEVTKMMLLSISDSVAAEAKYHKSCISSFENSPSTRLTPGRPTSEEKMSVFLSMCRKFEDAMEIYTLREFHEFMSKLGTH